jgi:excinuclease ABC subunit A
VGTVTEIYDYMRLLFARVGTPFSPETGLPIEAQQVQDMVDRVMAMEEGTRGYLLAPIVRDRKGSIAKNLPSCANKAFNASKSMVRFMIWTSRPRSTKNFATTSMWSSTGLWCAKGSKPVWPIVSARLRFGRWHHHS